MWIYNVQYYDDQALERMTPLEAKLLYDQTQDGRISLRSPQYYLERVSVSTSGPLSQRAHLPPRTLLFCGYFLPFVDLLHVLLGVRLLWSRVRQRGEAYL